MLRLFWVNRKRGIGELIGGFAGLSEELNKRLPEPGAGLLQQWLCSRSARNNASTRVGGVTCSSSVTDLSDAFPTKVFAVHLSTGVSPAKFFSPL
jgi:hypothetical protein